MIVIRRGFSGNQSIGKESTFLTNAHRDDDEQIKFITDSVLEFFKIIVRREYRLFFYSITTHWVHVLKKNKE
jgi:hypothetical protein